MATGMEVVIQAPKPVKRPWGLLLDMAPELEVPNEHWRAGVKTTSYGIVGLNRAADEYCITETPENLDANPAGANQWAFSSFTIFASESCSALDIDQAWLSGRLDDRIAVMASEQIAAELEHGGAGVEHPMSVDATVIQPAGVPINDALGQLEAWLALTLHGGVGMIHMTPQILANLQIRGSLTMVDGQWRTPTGHYIVADAGYEGTAPNAISHDPVAGNQFAYATGMVHVKIGEFSDLQDRSGDNFERTRNIFTGREVATAVFFYEVETVGAIEIEFPADPE